jgi:hypothetical protein
MEDFPDSLFSQKDYLISTYGEYNYALAKTLNELTGNYYEDVVVIKILIKLLNKLVLVTGRSTLPRPGIYLKSRLAHSLNTMYSIEYCTPLYNAILFNWFHFDKELIVKCVSWNYLNLQNFGTNKFKV